ncbi:MAG TPA: serine/threonine-protein kinase, partial [Candidatus Binatia bacterium]|nr:serine/threonine-protein kinase [Candidatus Binatia bacterium]
MAGPSGLNLSPGSILLARYRMLNLLGRGGMGLVYRADDLKLGQTVALKFLPTSLAHNRADLDRFLAEVRTARQVSHPNVCRVYDIAESEGHYFLSMEYVDGEDLASLLGRIGRLPPAKALEISHELCAGLAAAHARQVVHRDLKPANIMIDGRGHARITDFGLAVAPDTSKTGELAGTPAYMAPELFEGRSATVQSDLYALGIALYELYTGKHPWDRRPASDSRRRRSATPPSSPSHHAPEIDAAVDRIILRCLEEDPGSRPSSVLQVAAALPGGNPLALAIAAGETPSPEMVAAAGETGTIAPAKAWSLLASVAVALLIVAFLAQHAMLVNLVPSKDPALLVERSQQIASSLGYDRANDKAYWFDIDAAYFPYSTKITSPERYRSLATAFPSPLQFWYRQSPQALEPTHDPFRVNQNDPALYYSGEAEVGLDSAGRLNYFAAMAPQKETLPNSDAPPQWEDLFREASLDWSQSHAAPAIWMPDVPADRTFAWETVSSGQGTRVAGATYHGRIVFFRVLAPWAEPGRISPVFAPLAGRIGFAIFVVAAVAVFVLCLVFARKNLKLGRGDWRGALRASFFFLIVVFTGFLLTP